MELSITWESTHGISNWRAMWSPSLWAPHAVPSPQWSLQTIIANVSATLCLSTLCLCPVCIITYPTQFNCKIFSFCQLLIDYVSVQRLESKGLTSHVANARKRFHLKSIESIQSIRSYLRLNRFNWNLLNRSNPFDHICANRFDRSRTIFSRGPSTWEFSRIVLERANICKL